MATASVNRAMLWTDLEGQALPGGWRLKRLVRPEGRNAWFEALGPDGKPAMVSLTEALNDEDELLTRLQAASAIRHPNVVAVREARLVKAEDTPMVMAAMEPTEENLADVLRERTLDAVETRAVLEALLQGLAAIHAKKLTHGRMEAASVLAIGDTVKLRSDCLHVERFEERAPGDVAGVGRIVTQALTRRIPAGEHDPVLQLLPEPMGQAVRRALSGRATAEEMATLAGVRLVRAPEIRRHEPQAVEPRVTEPRVTEPRIAEPPVRELRNAGATALEPEAAEPKKSEPAPRESRKAEAPAPAAAAKVTAMPAPRVEEPATAARMDLQLRPRREQEIDEDDEPPQRRWEWNWQYHRWGAAYWIGAAVVLVAVTAWVLAGWMGHGKAPARAAAKPAVVVQHQPVVPAAAAVPVTAAQAGGPRMWRVVVDTYGSQKQAAARARTLGARYPGLRMGVLRTRRGDYLVTAGGRMTREQALALRARVVRMGLPRDAYAQNFR